MNAFTCHACGQTLNAPAAMAGQRTKCPACDTEVIIPERVTAPRRSARDPHHPVQPRKTTPPGVSPHLHHYQEEFGKGTNGKAIIGFALSLAGLLGTPLCCLPVLLSGLGVIFGHLALGEIAREPDMYEGRGLAIAALALGYLMLFGILILLLIGLTFPLFL